MSYVRCGARESHTRSLMLTVKRMMVEAALRKGHKQMIWNPTTTVCSKKICSLGTQAALRLMLEDDSTCPICFPCTPVLVEYAPRFHKTRTTKVFELFRHIPVAALCASNGICSENITILWCSERLLSVEETP